MYQDTVRRVGADDHVCTDELYEVLRAGSALGDDVVRGAEDVIIMGRIREMLLGDPAGARCPEPASVSGSVVAECTAPLVA